MCRTFQPYILSIHNIINSDISAKFIKLCSLSLSVSLSPSRYVPATTAKQCDSATQREKERECERFCRRFTTGSAHMRAQALSFAETHFLLYIGIANISSLPNRYILFNLSAAVVLSSCFSLRSCVRFICHFYCRPPFCLAGINTLPLSLRSF